MQPATIKAIINAKKAQEDSEKNTKEKILEEKLKKAALQENTKENFCVWDFYFSKKHLEKMEKKILNRKALDRRRPELLIFYINGKKYTNKCLLGEKPKWEDAILVEANVINPSTENPDALITYEFIPMKKK